MLKNIFIFLIFASNIYISIQIQLNLLYTDILDYSRISLNSPKCSGLKEQSPIDLQKSLIAKEKSPLLIVDLKYPNLINVKFGFADRNIFQLLGNIKDKGYILITKNGLKYKYILESIYLHIPSEHLINNKTNDLEFQLIHYKDVKYFNKNNNVREDPEKRDILIISKFYKASGKDKDSKTIENMNFENLSKFNFELNDFVNYNSSYYFYEGSLTIQDCEERVDWIIFKNKRPFSLRQLGIIKNKLRKYYPSGNARKISVLNKRKIYLQKKKR